MAEIDLSTKRARWPVLAGVLAVVVFFIVLVLALSWSNQGRMALVYEGGHVYVERGAFFPWGARPYEPSPAFAPLPVAEERVALLELGECASLVACEGRFYRSLIGLTAALLAEAKAEDVAMARHLIVRAQLFPSITLEERAPLEDLSGGVHYVEALVLLGDAQEKLHGALRKLERARIAGYGEPAALEALIEVTRRQLAALESARGRFHALTDTAAEVLAPL